MAEARGFPRKNHMSKNDEGWSILGQKADSAEHSVLASFDTEHDARSSFKAISSVMLDISWGFRKDS